MHCKKFVRKTTQKLPKFGLQNSYSSTSKWYILPSLHNFGLKIELGACFVLKGRNSENQTKEFCSIVHQIALVFGNTQHISFKDRQQH